MEKASESVREKNKFGKASRDRIVLDHLGLVKSIAFRVRENLPVHVQIEDLIQTGVMGLLDAASRYDAKKEVAFHTYAKHRIRGAMLDGLRQLDWASRDLRRRQKHVESVTRDLSTELQRPPTDAEIAAKMGVGIEKWREMVVELRMVALISTTGYSADPNKSEPLQVRAKQQLEPDSIRGREELREILEKAMQKLPPRYQKVVVLYYTNDMTMREIGQVLGINESRVSQIHKMALEKMAVVLQSTGIHSCAAF